MPHVAEYFSYYGLYEKGQLPTNDGIIYQSPKFMEAMSTISRALAEVKNGR
ncbi:MAG: hypothetical protein WC486_00205 [Candidatus Omnitrophota bacterium]